MNLRQLILDAVEYLFGMWRYRWVALAAAWLVALGGWFWVLNLPNQYDATARVFVDTQSMIRPLLRDMTVTPDTISQVRVVTQVMLSRPQLEAVAVQTGLDRRATTPQQLDSLITGLRRSVTISQMPRSEIFTIAYRDQDPVMARNVVQALLENFMESSLGKERTDSAQAQRFLEQQIRTYEERLVQAEERVADFRKANVGLMPGQGGDYFARLQGAEAAVREIEQQIAAVDNRRRELVRQLDGEGPALGGPGAGSQIPTTQDGEIARLEEQLRALTIQYTDRHPQVQRIQTTLETLRERQEEEREQLASGNWGSGAGMESNPVYQQLRIALSNTDVELASLRANLRDRQAAVDFLYRMVDTIPEVEAQLARLNRDYNIVRQQYERLVQRLESARLSEDVQVDTEGLAFEVIEPPRTPLTASGPNRPVLLSGVLVIALGAAMAIAFLLSLHSPVYFSGQRLSHKTGLPVYGLVGYAAVYRTSPVALFLFAFAGTALLAVYFALLVGGAGLLMAFARMA